MTTLEAYLLSLWLFVAVVKIVQCAEGNARQFEINMSLQKRHLVIQCLMWAIWPILVITIFYYKVIMNRIMLLHLRPRAAPSKE